MGRYLNDWIVVREMKRRHGVHEAEARLWSVYIGVAMYAIGLVILGTALQDHLNLSALIIGWGTAQAAVLVITVAVCQFFYHFKIKRGILYLLCVSQTRTVVIASRGNR